MSTTDIVKRREAAVAKAGDLDELVIQGAQSFMASTQGSMAETLGLAVAVVSIKEALTPEIMRPLMSLQGSALGFKTDKKYTEDVVKEALTEALIKGLPPAGNCFNIIAGRCYATKEGFTHLIKDLQAKKLISKFEFVLDVPVTTKERTTVRGRAKWMQNGEEQRIDCEIPIKTNSASTDDNTLGKAERKLKARCHERMTGLTLSDGDADLKPATGVRVEDSFDKATSPIESGDLLKGHTPVNEKLSVEKMTRGQVLKAMGEFIGTPQFAGICDEVFGEGVNPKDAELEDLRTVLHRLQTES